ncbi:MAG TPA: HEAT repeat domain-containing protein, partial [Gemmatimonadales bacterium]|nr:HEAT repeat domain-containing protein [Gemmatimonadales bacterium]
MIRSIYLLCAALVPPSPARAQDQADVEQLARILAAEDARDWQPGLLEQSLLAPDSVVRRTAALAAGRIGDLRATPLLLRAVEEPDSTVRAAAAFALGLLRDTAAVQPLIGRLTGMPPLDASAAAEGVTALAKIGGRGVAEFFAAVLQGKVALSQEDPGPATEQILLETWRLGPDAPGGALLQFADDTAQEVRWRAVYSLGRLRTTEASNHLIAALRAKDPLIRAAAARTLTRSYTEAAKMAPGSAAGVLARSAEDEDPGVRINALRSLGTYRDSTLTSRVVPRLGDQVPNVRVQAAATLGELGGAL